MRRTTRIRHINRTRARIREAQVPLYTHCKNCGNELYGIYCHVCGQHAQDIDPRIFDFIWQYCENAFNMDGKYLITIRRLFTHPGRLSTEFIRGHLKRYVSPLKFYMLMAVVFSFVIIGVTSSNGPILEVSAKSAASTADAPLSNKITRDHSITQQVHTTDKSQEVADGKKDEFLSNGSNFIERIPIIIMFAMPMFALFSRLFYRRKYQKYLPHLIFSLHLHTIIFTVISFLLLIDVIVDSIAMLLPSIVLIFWLVRYGYIASIRFYGDVWWLVILKNTALYSIYSVFCMFVLTLGLVIILCFESLVGGHGFMTPMTHFIN